MTFFRADTEYHSDSQVCPGDDCKVCLNVEKTIKEIRDDTGEHIFAPGTSKCYFDSVYGVFQPSIRVTELVKI